MITNSLEVAATATAARELDAAITVRGLRKTYGSVQALDGVDLTVRRGEVLALLGPNGAGKTTLVEILEGHRVADAGEVCVLGYDPAKRERAFRERIGIVLQEEGLDQTLTVREAIELYGAAVPEPAARRRGHRAGRPDRAARRARRHALRRPAPPARPRARHRRRPRADLPRRADDRLRPRGAPPVVGADRRPRDLGKTILLTTHYMEEAQHLADRVVVIANGRVIAEGTPDTLGRGQAEAALVTFRTPAGFDASELPLPDDAALEHNGATLSFRTPTPTRDLAPLLAWAADRGIELEGLTVTRPTLEDVYLQLTEEPA